MSFVRELEPVAAVIKVDRQDNPRTGAITLSTFRLVEHLTENVVRICNYWYGGAQRSASIDVQRGEMHAFNGIFASFIDQSHGS